MRKRDFLPGGAQFLLDHLGRQDEDLRALANLFGGECLRYRAPRKADFFYKRLVKQSPNSPVARIADKLRWFPNSPTLKKELGSAMPYKSLDEVKKVIGTADIELREILKQREKAPEEKKTDSPPEEAFSAHDATGLPQETI